MDIETLARLEVANGSPVAFHDGVWWRRVKPFYSQPLHPLGAFSPGQARPPFLYRMIGYEHPVPTPAEANAKLGLMILTDIKQYDISRLSSKKRNQIRRGLERAEVRKMDDIRDLVKQGVEINRSALLRQGPRLGSSSFRWFVDEKLWRQEIERTHALGARESWGAYCNGRLVAWLRAYELEGVIDITGAMSHSTYLGYYPNDALIHTFLMDCKARPGVARVVFGWECAKRSLDEYKMRFGFQAVHMPIYRRLSPGVRSVISLTHYRQYLPKRDPARNH